MSAHPSSVLIGSFPFMYFYFFSVRIFLFLFPPTRGNSLKFSSSLYKFCRSPIQSPTLFRLSRFLLTALSHLLQ